MFLFAAKASDARFFTGDNGVGFTYNSTQPSLVPWYSSATCRISFYITR